MRFAAFLRIPESRATDAGVPMPDASAQGDRLQQLATEILNRNKSHLRELRIEPTDGGVMLRGVAITFYGKHIAFHEVGSQEGIVVVGNEIEVKG
jgi:hypothetical protein